MALVTSKRPPGAVAPRKHGRHRDARGPRHGVLFTVLVLVVLWLPIPLGSNRAWSWGLLAALALGMLGYWLLSYARKPFVVPAVFRSLRLPLVLLGLWLVYLLIQVVPVSDTELVRLNPSVHAAYAGLAGSGIQGPRAISLDRGAGVHEWFKLAGYVALFLVAVAVTTTHRRLKLLLGAIFLAGFANAIFGLVSYYTRDWSGLWYPGRFGNAVAGTYVNRNHFAGLMELTIPAGMGLILAGMRARREVRSFRDVLSDAVTFLLRRNAVFAFGVLIMCTALILSTSRGGIAALGIAIALVVGISVAFRGRRSPESRIIPGAAIVLAVSVAWFGIGGLADKLSLTDLGDNRAILRGVSAEMIADAPVFGMGAGTFRWVFPRYKPQELKAGVYEHAHNDYLELAVEQGAIGFALAAGAIGALYVVLLRGYRRRRDPAARGALFAALTGVSALLLHGLVDFNFRIPANAAYFFVLLAVGIAATRIRHEPRREPSRRRTAEFTNKLRPTGAS